MRKDNTPLLISQYGFSKSTVTVRPSSTFSEDKPAYDIVKSKSFSRMASMSNQPLWQPDQKTIKQSHMLHFIKAVNAQYHCHFKNYNALYEWSIQHPDLFWEILAAFSKIHFSQQPTKIMQTEKAIWQTKWFIDAKLNFAENLLQRRDDHIALIYANEKGERTHISYQKLFSQVKILAKKLKFLGLKPGDRVAGFVTNQIETVIAMLASTALGAIWTACGPEFGIDALIDRFSQIEPVILFVTKEHTFGGKQFSHTETIKQLKENLPSVQKIITLAEIKNESDQSATQQKNEDAFIFQQLDFNHPLYILFSSGTTGKPKCMVHGAGHILIQHKKELLLHTDLHEKDVLFFYTTCSWMMWHWMISGLSIGATLVLYDGSPFYPNNTTLLDLIDEFNISIFGCGAKIIETYSKKNVVPRKSHQLKKLKTILTTGSPLIKTSFEYIYRDVKKEARVSSISGGSDIVSCFALGNPLLPVYAEELQCRGLGMQVEIYDNNGKSIFNQPGELVCSKAFPSMPLYFWNDPTGEKYFHAYFDRFSNVWTHGDYAKTTEHNGIIILGRSDATLNPGGIRIGTADIYESALKINAVMDCVAVGLQKNNDEHVILFVTLKNNLKLDEKLISDIKKNIRVNTTPFHVPKKIIQVTDIPKTMNGKTMEIVVKKIINGLPISNIETLANPDCLQQYEQLNFDDV